MNPGTSESRTVAIIVPLYRVEDFVKATLESVRAQTYVDWDCIVVDDGSPDSSVERALDVIDSEPRMRIIRQANQGLAGARNTGLKNMTTDARYVAFLDSDDTWVPETLADLVLALEHAPDAVGSYGYAELMDEHGEPLALGSHPARQKDRRRIAGRRLQAVPIEEPMTFEGALVVGSLWPPAVGLHRRSVVDLVGPFDASLAQMEDWDFYLRMLRHGNYVVVQKQVAWYRQHGAQMTHRHLEAAHASEQVRRKTWASPLNTPDQRRAATRTFRQLQARHTVRTAERLVSALRRREWIKVGPLLAGTLILAIQTFSRSYPRVTRRQLDWSGRTRQ